MRGRGGSFQHPCPSWVQPSRAHPHPQPCGQAQRLFGPQTALSLTSLCSESSLEQKPGFKADFRIRSGKHFQTHSLLEVKPCSSKQQPLCLLRRWRAQALRRPTVSHRRRGLVGTQGTPGDAGTHICGSQPAAPEEVQRQRAARWYRAAKGSPASSRLYPCTRVSGPHFGPQMGKRDLPRGSGDMGSRV